MNESRTHDLKGVLVKFSDQKMIQSLDIMEDPINGDPHL